jgi:hypothetical protein
MFVQLTTPIPVEVEGGGPALAIGSVEVAGQDLAIVVIAKVDGQISVKPFWRLRGTAADVTGAQWATSLAARSEAIGRMVEGLDVSTVWLPIIRFLRVQALEAAPVSRIEDALHQINRFSRIANGQSPRCIGRNRATVIAFAERLGQALEQVSPDNEIEAEETGQAIHTIGAPISCAFHATKMASLAPDWRGEWLSETAALGRYPDGLLAAELKTRGWLVFNVKTEETAGIDELRSTRGDQYLLKAVVIARELERRFAEAHSDKESRICQRPGGAGKE